MPSQQVQQLKNAAIRAAQNQGVSLVKDFDQALTDITNTLKQNNIVDDKQIGAAVDKFQKGLAVTNSVIGRVVGANNLPPELKTFSDASAKLLSDYAELKRMQTTGANQASVFAQQILVAADMYSARNAAVGAFNAAGLNVGTTTTPPPMGAGTQSTGTTPAMPLTQPVFDAKLKTHAGDLENLSAQLYSTAHGRTKGSGNVTDPQLAGDFKKLGERLADTHKLLADAQKQGLAVDPKVLKSFDDLNTLHQMAAKNYGQLEQLESKPSSWKDAFNGVNSAKSTQRTELDINTWRTSELAKAFKANAH